MVKYKYKSRCTSDGSKNEENYMYVFKVKLQNTNGHWTWQQQYQKLLTSTNWVLFTDIIIRAGVGNFYVTSRLYTILLI